MAEVALEPQAGVPGHGPDPIAGRSPWALAFRRLRRNRIAFAALVLFILIVLSSFAAPIYANHIAHTDPFENNVNGTTIVNGKEVPLMEQGGGVLKLGETPIGPTWDIHHYFLGADAQGRDVMARLLYGGRSSLADRDRLGAHRVPDRDGPRADRRLLLGAHRLAPVTDDGRDLGVSGASCSPSALEPCS